MENVSIFRSKCPTQLPVLFHIWMSLEAPSFVGVPAQRLPPLRRFDPLRDRSQLLPLAAQETNACPSPARLTVHRHKKAAEIGGEDQHKNTGSKSKTKTASEMAIVIRDVFVISIALLVIIILRSFG